MASDAPKSQPASPLGVRLFWFAGLWLASVATVGLVSLSIKWALK